MKYVVPLNNASDKSEYGGKAANLSELMRFGLPVPQGLAIGISAFDSSGKLLAGSADELCSQLNPDKLYAVRSSALAEDAEEASWAGQFETFLDTPAKEVVRKVEECHNSAKARAKAYAAEKSDIRHFDIAVVVQEMVKPEFAGVLFTKDPVTGKDNPVTEYVEGLGDELVSGKADPKHLIVNKGIEAPFDTKQLLELAKKVEALFKSPQDIEWASSKNKIWLVQARPITVIQETRMGYYLGEPNDLFYWGPSRAKSLYMSDFMSAAERLFSEMAQSSDLPSPPKTLVLFNDGKMVWLNNARAFSEFTEKTFEAYSKQNRLDDDIARWKRDAKRLPHLNGKEFYDKLVDAWYATEFAEFSLYGAEAALTKQLERFEADVRQEIWGAFTTPDKPTFLTRIDNELFESKDAAAMAKNYPWIQDGYEGVSDTALQYFQQRMEIIDSKAEEHDLKEKRDDIKKKYSLTDNEVGALDLARELAVFMDARKAWMMQTRRLLTRSVNDIEHGWFFKEGSSNTISKEDAIELWQRYVEFKASSSAVAGIVASNGGKHFVNGKVAVACSPTDNIADGQILVVPSTSPSYVPLMRKAKALITDHGGMMSHAAIVAREFNLPCIVGTKQATKVLSTGDKVVIDLVKGEVSKK